jgi:hypothetical protein
MAAWRPSRSTHELAGRYNQSSAGITGGSFSTTVRHRRRKTAYYGDTGFSIKHGIVTPYLFQEMK